MGQLELAHVERFSYKSADDWDIDGFGQACRLA